MADQSEGKRFFFEKKKQKTSITLGCAGFNTTAPNEQKFFAPLFFKKAAASLLFRAFLWGVASALALPPVHFLPVLLLSMPAFLRLIGAAQSKKQLGLIAWLFGFGLNLGGLYWITEPILTEVATFWWLVPLAAPLLAAAVAFYTLIPAFAARAVKPGLPRLLVFSGAWVISDLIRQFAFSGFPWNLWGTDWTIPGALGNIFIQPAALIGVHGLTLLTVFLAGMPLFKRRGLVVLMVALGLWGGFGLWRLQTPVKPTGIKVALVQPNFPVPGAYDRASLIARWQQLLAMSHAGLAAGADTVVWPEGSSPWLLDSDEAAREQLANVTGTAPILAGSLRIAGPNDFRNSLVVTAGPVPALAVYDKWKLVPFGEYMPKWIPVKITPDMLGTGFTPGPGPATIARLRPAALRPADLLRGHLHRPDRRREGPAGLAGQRHRRCLVRQFRRAAPAFRRCQAARRRGRTATRA